MSLNFDRTARRVANVSARRVPDPLTRLREHRIDHAAQRLKGEHPVALGDLPVLRDNLGEGLRRQGAFPIPAHQHPDERRIKRRDAHRVLLAVHVVAARQRAVLRSMAQVLKEVIGIAQCIRFGLTNS